MSIKKHAKLFFKTLSSVMLFLIINVRCHSVNIPYTHTECTVSFLPTEFV